jgi:hypothetical protein
VEEIQMSEQEKKALLSETETDHVAGGAGNHFGQLAKEQNVRPWALPDFKGKGPDDAPGHNKV